MKEKKKVLRSQSKNFIMTAKIIIIIIILKHLVLDFSKEEEEEYINKNLQM